ncbi:MAG: ABC transporter ATP-binding protein [Deltaproteobacteria bacterium]|jgi:oligopeptide transport system ATP-binding protein|nr:ABC transporter ATP-binding protein [Deltaproteobacteria bacterium]MBW2531283.1 ABC transporter ATP-binding protein [Deltaproteobacteria bacterium]
MTRDDADQRTSQPPESKGDGAEAEAAGDRRPRLELATESADDLVSIPPPADGDSADAPGDGGQGPDRAATRPSLGRRRRAKRKPTAALIYVQKLTKLYPVQRGWLRRPQLLHALNGVSFYVRRHETFGLVGESGCGKSTLARCLIRLTEPTVGRVIFDGRDVTALSPSELRLLRQRMQIVFQNPFSSLNPNMTVSEIVREGMEVFRLAPDRPAMDARVVELLDQVGLSSRMVTRYPHELSGGQRQRIAIARALAVEPEFIVLDEPLTALDLSVQAQIINLLDDLQQELGLTLLFISHDLRAVQYLSHRMAIMYGGRLMEMGPTQAILRKRYHPYTRALLKAMPAAPWLEAELPTGEPPPSEPPPSANAASRPDAMPASEPAPTLPDAAGADLLRAQPPSATAPPRGCPLFDRCPCREPGQCDVHEPDLLELVKHSHHRVACWHPHLDD